MLCEHVLSCTVRPTTACEHLMCFKELAVERGSLNMVLANIETRWSYIICGLVYSRWCVSVGQWKVIWTWCTVYTTLGWLMLFRKISAVYYENHEKRINKLYQKREYLNVKLRLVHMYCTWNAWRTSGVSSPHQHKDTCSYQYTSAVFDVLPNIVVISVPWNFICGDT
jgi:hypothetical protein